MIHGQARVANVVLDVGSFHTFAGQAGLQNPKFSSNSYLVQYQHKKDKYAAGKEALESPSNHKQIYSVFQNAGIDGKVDKFHFNIDKFDKFVETILMDNLELDNCSISLLIAEDMSVQLDPSEVLKQRQKIVQYLLQGMELTNIAFFRKPVLSTFALGCTSSVVFDSGHSFSHCSIIEDGYCVFNKTLRLGGSIINNLIQEQIELKNSGRPYKTTRELGYESYREGDISFHRILQLLSIAQKFTYIPTKSANSADSQVSFTLPDGNSVKIGRNQIIDPFVNFAKFLKKYEKNNWKNLPDFIESDFFKLIGNYGGLSSFLFSTINDYFTALDAKNHTIATSTDSSKKKSNQLGAQDLLNNVILTGGNLCFNDIGWNIANNVRNKGGRILEGPLQFNKDSEGNQCENYNSLSWIGGSIVCNLETFSHFWIKYTQWKELGLHSVSSKNIGGNVGMNSEYEEYIRNGKKLELVSKKCA